MRYKIAFSSCVGTCHQTAGLPCQDACDGKVCDNHAAIALADGAGSCLNAELGAKTVVHTVLNLLEAHADEWLDDVTVAVENVIVSESITAIAANGLPVDTQASTLLFCLARNNGEFLCGHIGDGYIFIANNDAAELLSDAENGRFINETVFVTSPNAEEHLRLYRGQLLPGQAIFLCSDGAGEVLFSRDKRICAPAVSIISQWLRKNPEELVSLSINDSMNTLMREFTADDMSIAVLYLSDDEDKIGS